MVQKQGMKRYRMGRVVCVCLFLCCANRRNSDMMDLEVAANMRHSFPILRVDGGLDPS